MPVGCVHQFIVVKRKSVLRALESAVETVTEIKKLLRECFFLASTQTSI